MCQVRNVIVFFYGYVCEGYYENNVDRRFNYLSGYADNSTTRLSHLVSHPEGEPMPLSEWSTRDNIVGLLRLKIMRRWGRERYKRLGYLVMRCLPLMALLYILLYILLCNVEGWSTILFHTYIIPSTSIVSYIRSASHLKIHY